MNYCETKPHPRLARFIECLWSAQDRGPVPHDRPPAPERILPDGCMELIAHLGAPFRRTHADGSSEPQPRIFLVGQMTRFLLVQPTGSIAVLGVRFRPGGARPFFPLDLDELTDRVVPLPDLWGAMARDLECALHEATSATMRFQLLERALHGRLSAARAKDDGCVEAVVGEILARRGSVSVEALSARAGLSQRQLARRFRAAVGLRPKTLCRILRYQGIFHALASTPAPAWVSLALEAGYFDQAHFIRDFREFSGMAPQAYFHGTAPPGSLASRFTSRERLDALFGLAD